MYANVLAKVIDILHQLATLLVSFPASYDAVQTSLTFSQNTHLDRQQLSYCVSLIENGVNPEALAVRETLGSSAE